jgi:hypothetical protein
MAKLRIILGLATAIAVAGCVAKPEAPPAPEPVPVPTPTPSATPTPVVDWQDMALTPGTWTYGTGAGAPIASFGVGTQAQFTVRCDTGRRQVVLARTGTAAGNTLTVRTSFGQRSLPLTVEPGSPQLVARLPASDKLLDDIAFSRGRFTVLVPGTPLLVIPAWPEPARVIEDCRS